MKQVEEQKIVCEKIETKFKGEKNELKDELMKWIKEWKSRCEEWKSRCESKEEQLKVKENSFKNE